MFSEGAEGGWGSKLGAVLQEGDGGLGYLNVSQDGEISGSYVQDVGIDVMLEGCCANALLGGCCACCLVCGDH